jgi:hydrogenase expression/formation protein HypE
VGLILEEGLPITDLRKIVGSMAETARAVGVRIVTGDTKVVERGRGDGIYINTAGIGRVERPGLGAKNIRPGDAVLVSGPLGEHGVAVLSCREGIAFQTSVVSDCAPLWSVVAAVLATGAEVRALRDPTRGGLAATVCDWATVAGVGIRLEEKALPVSAEVRGACDLLGLDPLTIANEGKLVVCCPAADADKVLTALGRAARIIGEVTAKPKGRATLRTLIGGERVLDLPNGEDLPRIC